MPSPLPILVLDTETTGLDPNRHQLLEVSAAKVDPVSWRVLDHWHGVRKIGDEITGNPVAIEYHLKNGLLQACRGGDAYTSDVFRRTFEGWLDKNFGPSIIVAGKNVWKLDLPIIEADLGIPLTRWHHRSIDPGPLLWSPGEEPPSLAECAKRLGVELVTDDHRSDTGVRHTLLVLRAYYECRRGG